MTIEELSTYVVNAVWGPYMVALLVGGGLYLTLRSRGIPFLRIPHAFQVLRGKYDDPNDPGEITHLQALTTALASTVGMGNIAGVAVAISQGGPGAVFWMWITALVGMATKFFTCTLACMYRKVDEQGIPQGGPMYYIEQGLGPKFKPLAIMFSVCGLVGCLAMLQANQLAELMKENYHVPRPATAAVIVIGVGVVVLGGLQRLVKFSEKLVPTMCGVYVFAALLILGLRINVIPGVLHDIVTLAFTGHALIGGGLGTIIVIGVKRAAFSNEAGIGTAPMAHGAAKTDEPVREGLVAMLGPFIDTIIVCTMTALVILTSDLPLLDPTADENTLAVTLTTKAFETGIGQAGNLVVAFAVVLFSLTTMFGYSYYGRKCWTYLAGHQRGYLYNYAYIASLAIGAMASLNLVMNILDTAFALMAIPNMIATILLAPRVVAAAKDYFARHADTLPEAEV